MVFAFSLAGSRKAFETQCGPGIVTREKQARERRRRSRAEAESDRQRWLTGKPGERLRPGTVYDLADRLWAAKWRDDGAAVGRLIRGAGKPCTSVVRHWLSLHSRRELEATCPKTGADERCRYRYAIDLLSEEVRTQSEGGLLSDTPYPDAPTSGDPMEGDLPPRPGAPLHVPPPHADRP